MRKSKYEEIDLSQHQELIESWQINDDLLSVKFDNLRFYHEDSATGNIDIGALGSILFIPEENTIKVDYSFWDDSFDEIKWCSSFFLYEYQKIDIDDVNSDLYVILSFNTDSTIAFFTGDAEKGTKILVYLKYWNYLRTIKREGAIQEVGNVITCLNNNDKIQNAAKNFIEMLPPEVFINYHIYRAC